MKTLWKAFLIWLLGEPIEDPDPYSGNLDRMAGMERPPDLDDENRSGGRSLPAATAHPYDIPQTPQSVPYKPPSLTPR